MTYGRELDQALPGGGRGQAWQRSDGLVQLRAPDEEGLELLRFCLALDADTTEFTQRFRNDPLLGLSIRRLHGLRPLRRPTVAAALLRAICGQLIEARRAFAIERAILRAIGEPAPRRRRSAALSPAQLRKLGLATHRASTLVRVCRSLDLEGLRDAADRGGRGAAPARARARALVARRDRARGARAASATASSATSASSSSARAPGPLGRDLRDGRAAGALRGVGRARRRLPDAGLERGARPRRERRPRQARALPSCITLA